MFINVDLKLFKLNLNYGEIFLLALITNYSKGNKFFMSNELIAKHLNTSTRTIKRWIANLRDNELIQIYYENIAGKERRIIVPKIVN